MDTNQKAGNAALDLIFDADDTLWDSNIHFLAAQEAFVAAALEVGVAAARADVLVQLRRCELELIPIHGYGRGPYVIALHRAVAALSDDEPMRVLMRNEAERIGVRLIEQHCELLPGVEETVNQLAERHRLTLFTKGQRDEQVRKLERSGLAPLFSRVETPAEKDVAAYRRLVEQARLDPARAFMIGNSPRSDINPALRAGLRAVFIPHPHTWDMEQEEIDTSDERIITLPNFPALLEVF